MKRIVVFSLLVVLIIFNIHAQSDAAEISFTYTKLAGMASNQFAVWVEDSQGQFIKTLYATKFTADGGWKRRPSSLPVWVQKSAISELSKSQIDAISGATPKAGIITYTWDGKDGAGKAVGSGEFVIILEATLRSENQVYYRSPIRLGQGAASARVNPEYIGDAGKDRSMIGNVTVKTLR